MFKNFLPRNDAFFDFFERHAAVTVRGAKGLLGFGLPNKSSEEAFQEIKTAELEGDMLVHECMEALHKTFITPFDRADIHHLISTMDDVLDEIQGIAQLIVLYKISSLQHNASDLVTILIQLVLETEEAIKEVRKMKNTSVMQKAFIRIQHLENEADTIYIRALEKLFDEEKDPITVIKWKEIYERLEEATDVAEDVANILEGIVLEYE